MSIEQHEFRREKPDGSYLRARILPEGDGHVMEVQWIKPNKQPAHQPLKVGLSKAEGLFEQLAGFAKEMTDRTRE